MFDLYILLDWKLPFGQAKQVFAPSQGPTWNSASFTTNFEWVKTSSTLLLAVFSEQVSASTCYSGTYTSASSDKLEIKLHDS